MYIPSILGRTITTFLLFTYLAAADDSFDDFSSSSLLTSPFIRANASSDPSSLPDFSDSNIDLRLFDRDNDPCGNAYNSCQNAGAPGLCCPTNAVCSADAVGNVACCPIGAACTGTVSGSSTSVNNGGGGGGVLTITTTTGQQGQSTLSGGYVLATTTVTVTTTSVGFQQSGGGISADGTTVVAVLPGSVGSNLTVRVGVVFAMLGLVVVVFGMC